MSEPRNTGDKVFTVLVEINTRTGLPTGRTKPNIPSDPNYIAPSEDLDLCPIPGDPVIPTIDVLVDLSTGFTSANVKLNYGSLDIDRNTSGTWTITDRTYDSILFEIPTLGSPEFTVQIEYGVSQVKKIEHIEVIGNFFIIGPFVNITKISIIPTAGDFNDDYNDDFYN